MERILTVEQMRSADEFSIKNLGIPAETLVERAGNSVAEEIFKRFHGGRVLVCIGKGNNGEDGKVIARLLRFKHGYNVTKFIIGENSLDIFNKKFDIIIDCIFGTGLNRQVEGEYKKVIDKINQSGAYVISCDIPSGLNGNSGLAMGVAVKAKLTVAIQDLKLGYFLNDGPDYCGEIVVKDIGISVWEDDYAKRLDDFDLKKLFQARNRNSNKGNFGKVSVFGGSKDYPGSILISLNALCALKMGTGYSNIAIPECIYSICAGLNPENTVISIKSINGHIDFDKVSLDKLMKFSSIAFGMGVKVSPEVNQTLKYLLENYEGNLLIDADGLNTLAEFGLEVLKNKKCRVVLTPHVGEFARLIKKDKSEIINNSIELTKDFAKKYGVVLVLKSAVSIITDGIEVYLNTTGTPAMAKGGSGDLLSGIIAGLLARTSDCLISAVSGCYIFGKAGELATKKANEYTVTATDIINSLPEVINGL